MHETTFVKLTRVGNRPAVRMMQSISRSDKKDHEMEYFNRMHEKWCQNNIRAPALVSLLLPQFLMMMLYVALLVANNFHVSRLMAWQAPLTMNADNSPEGATVSSGAMYWPPPLDNFAILPAVFILAFSVSLYLMNLAMRMLPRGNKYPHASMLQYWKGCKDIELRFGRHRGNKELQVAFLTIGSLLYVLTLALGLSTIFHSFFLGTTDEQMGHVIVLILFSLGLAGLTGAATLGAGVLGFGISIGIAIIMGASLIIGSLSGSLASGLLVFLLGGLVGTIIGAFTAYYFGKMDDKMFFVIDIVTFYSVYSLLGAYVGVIGGEYAEGYHLNLMGIGFGIVMMLSSLMMGALILTVFNPFKHVSSEREWRTVVLYGDLFSLIPMTSSGELRSREEVNDMIAAQDSKLVIKKSKISQRKARRHLQVLGLQHPDDVLRFFGVHTYERLLRLKEHVTQGPEQFVTKTGMELSKQDLGIIADELSSRLTREHVLNLKKPWGKLGELSLSDRLVTCDWVIDHDKKLKKSLQLNRMGHLVYSKTKMIPRLEKELKNRGLLSIEDLVKSVYPHVTVDDPDIRNDCQNMIKDLLKSGRIHGMFQQNFLVGMDEQALFQALQKTSYDWSRVKPFLEGRKLGNMRAADVFLEVQQIRERLRALEEVCKKLHLDILLRGIKDLQREIHETLRRSRLQ